MSDYTPKLWVAEVDDQVRIGLGELGYAEGPTLQEAADALVAKVLLAVLAVRSGGIEPAGTEVLPNPGALRFLWELGEIAARGGDIRDRLFGPDSAAA
jgi:hypothetical protein